MVQAHLHYKLQALTGMKFKIFEKMESNSTNK